MRQISRREWITLSLTVVVLGSFLIQQLVIKPIQEGSNDAERRIQLTQKKLKKNYEIISQTKNLEKQIQEIENNFGFVDSDDEESSAMVDGLESVARQTNVQIVNMQPQRSQVKKWVKVFLVEMTLGGSWPNIVHFLHLAQSAPNNFYINQLNLEKFSDNASLLRGRLTVSRLRAIRQ